MRVRLHCILQASLHLCLEGVLQAAVHGGCCRGSSLGHGLHVSGILGLTVSWEVGSRGTEHLGSIWKEREVGKDQKKRRLIRSFRRILGSLRHLRQRRCSYHFEDQIQTGWLALAEPHSHSQLSGKAALVAADQGWKPHPHYPGQQRWLCQEMGRDCSAPVSPCCSVGPTETSVARRAPQVGCRRCCRHSGQLASAADPGIGSAVDSQWTQSCCQTSSGLERTWAPMGPAGAWQR